MSFWYLVYVNATFALLFDNLDTDLHGPRMKDAQYRESRLLLVEQ